MNTKILIILIGLILAGVLAGIGYTKLQHTESSKTFFHRSKNLIKKQSEVIVIIGITFVGLSITLFLMNIILGIGAVLLLFVAYTQVQKKE